MEEMPLRATSRRQRRVGHGAGRTDASQGKMGSYHIVGVRLSAESNSVRPLECDRILDRALQRPPGNHKRAVATIRTLADG